MKNIARFVLAINLLASNVHSDTVTAPPPPSTAVENEKLRQEYFAHISDISGTWNPASLGYGYTALANLAHTHDDVQTIAFSFFPMEYCQAIRICVPPDQEFSGSTPFKVQESMCTSYIDYSPASGKITISNKPAADITGYADELVFRSNPGVGHNIFIHSKPFYRSESFKPMDEKTKALTKKLLIVLTNSRQCQVNINIEGSLAYSDLLIKDRTDSRTGKTELPAIFHYGGSIDALPTFYTETSTGRKRTQDFLPQLKSLTKISNKLKNIKYKCKVAAGSKTSASTVKQHSFVHAKKQTSNFQVPAGTPKITRITVEMEQCHWFRLWFTSKDTKWDKYATTIQNEIHQTIDLFFDEGFALLPDREHALRLPGGSIEIKSIVINHHGKGIGEISFGYIENDRINSINFKMDILKEPETEIFLIRSPYCDANFGSEGVSTGTFGSGSSAKVFNMVVMKNCEINSIEKPS